MFVRIANPTSPWRGKSILVFRGCAQSLRRENDLCVSGERIKSCAMIICEPNEFVAEVHDRMPVLLQPDKLSPEFHRKRSPSDV